MCYVLRYTLHIEAYWWWYIDSYISYLYIFLLLIYTHVTSYVWLCLHLPCYTVYLFNMLVPGGFMHVAYLSCCAEDRRWGNSFGMFSGRISLWQNLQKQLAISTRLLKTCPEVILLLLMNLMRFSVVLSVVFSEKCCSIDFGWVWQWCDGSWHWCRYVDNRTLPLYPGILLHAF